MIFKQFFKYKRLLLYDISKTMVLKGTAQFFLENFE